MSEKVTFKELVEQIARQSKQSHSSTNNFIHELVKIIEKGLKDSGSVTISGFGKFELQEVNPSQRLHPKTGEQMTVPGQIKVVFKPFKKLRDGVNLPFQGIASSILTQAAEKIAQEGDTSVTFESEETGIPGSSQHETSDSTGHDDSVSDEPSEENTLDGLLIEHDNPRFKKSAPAAVSDSSAAAGSDSNVSSAESDAKSSRGTNDIPSADESTSGANETDVIRLGYGESRESADAEKRSGSQSVAPGDPYVPANEEKVLADEVQKAGSYNWSYAAAVIVAILIFIILFFMYQQYQEESDMPMQAMPDLQNQPGQTETLPPSADVGQDDALAQGDAADQDPAVGQDPAGNQGQASATDQDSGVTQDNAADQDPATDQDPVADNTDSPDASSQTSSGGVQTEFVTENFTVEPGQSLWTIADTRLGNPYLWPVLYHLNQEKMVNPNFLPADSDIILPFISDPDNLNEFEREQVAHGYFKLYEWNVQNNPDEARFFLWAVGVFSASLLDNPPSDVIQEDLDFARNR